MMNGVFTALTVATTFIVISAEKITVLTHAIPIALFVMAQAKGKDTSMNKIL